MTKQSLSDIATDPKLAPIQDLKYKLTSAVYYAFKTADMDKERINYSYPEIKFHTESQMTEFEVDVTLIITEISDKFKSVVDEMVIDYIKTFLHSSVQYDQDKKQFIFTTTRL